jgi:single-strand DNA-binding protein
MNIVIIAGNLGADPELRYTQAGDAILKLRVATAERYKNKAGEWQEKTEWHSVTLWGARGEALSKMLQKGSKVIVRGRLQTRSWEAKDGQKRYSTEIAADDVEFGSSRTDQNGRARPSNETVSGTGTRHATVRTPKPEGNGFGADYGDDNPNDDVPF